MPRLVLAVALFGFTIAPKGSAQSVAVTAERAELTAWLHDNPTSPWRAVTMKPIGRGLTLGPGTADIPLQGVEAATIRERDGRVTLVTAGSSRPLPRGRAVSLGSWQLMASGVPGRTVVAVFKASPAAGKEPGWYPYDARAAFPVSLVPPASPATQRILGPDGVEVDATDAGTVSVPFPTGARTLHVLRLPGATEEETELEIFFRDGTSGQGSYPAGRFVALIPQGGSRHLLDFNRARNPWCAYSSAYSCPIPWRGNTLDLPIRAGERYAGGGLDTPKPE